MVNNERAQPSGQQQLAPVVELEERKWLARHQTGDTNAFAELLAAYQRPIYSYLVRSGIPESVRDDIFQDIFLKIHAAAASYQSSQPLRPWLFTIAANTVRNHFRAQRSHSHVSWEQTEQDPVDPQPGIEKQIESNNTVTWLEHTIPTLPLAQREVLLLTAIEGLRLQDTATVLNMPLNTVKTHLRRARLTLTKALAKRETTDSEGTSDDNL